MTSRLTPEFLNEIHTLVRVNSPPAFPSTENGRRRCPPGPRAARSPIGDPVAATDLNAGDSNVNDPLVYSLTGTDAASFTIDAGTGQIRLAQDATLDYEGKRSYRVTVEVTDGRDQNGDDDMDAIDDTITVTNVNEAPVVTGDAAPSFQENSSAAVATYTAADPERDTLTWSVSVDDFWISSRGRLYFRTPPSFEGQTTYQVTVTSTDDDETTPLAGSLAVSVTVTDAEEEGVVAITPPRGWVDVPTQFIADLADDDGGVTGTTWQWARSPNGRSNWTHIAGETSSSYTAAAADANQYLRATASYEDRRGSNKTASAALTAPVGDARPATNTPPEFTEDDDDTDAGRSTTRSVSAGTAAGRNIGSPVRATDADQGDVLTYSLSGADADEFDIDAATGRIRTKDVLDHDPNGDNTYEVTVSVHDGFDGGYNESSASDDTIKVTITVTAVRRPTSGGGGGGTSSNRAPLFIEGAAASRTVAEDAAAGQDIGEPLEAVDPDLSDTLTYTLEGEDAAYFDIDATTGQLRTKAALDYETRTTYTLTVRVADSQGSQETMEVTVTVTNVGLEGVVGRYDTNDNGAIERDEAIAAVVDYFADLIDKEEAVAIVVYYLTQPQPSPADVPSFVDGSSTERTLRLFAQPGDAVGDPVSATHPTNLALTYSLGGADATLFTVDAETGQIRLREEVTLALGQSFTVNLTATAGSGPSAVIDVSIKVDHPYDLDQNGAFEKDEVVKAVIDYFAGLIDREEVLAIVAYYFAQ